MTEAIWQVQAAGSIRQTRQGLCASLAGLNTAQQPGAVPRLLADRDRPLHLSLRQHKRQPHPQVEGVPKIPLWDLALLLQPAEERGALPAPRVNAAMDTGRQGPREVLRKSAPVMCAMPWSANPSWRSRCTSAG